MKIAFVYSGQGAQYFGMGKELYDRYESAKNVFSEASEILGLDMQSLCFEENDQLHQTTYTQPAILTVSMAIDAILAEHGLQPDIVAGLSLGEYSAFVKAGVLSFPEALQLVKKRGHYMTEAVPLGKGAMAAVMGLDRLTIEKVCEEVAKEHGVVSPANYNMPGQIAIAGLKEPVEIASQRLVDAGAKRVVPLTVSGPFHTSLLEPAAMQLQEAIQSVSINEPSIPIVSNTTALPFKNAGDIKNLMVKQVMSPVYWEDSVRKMIDMDVDTFIEIGPGKTLSSFIKKIDKTVTTTNVENLKSLEKTLQKMGIAY